MYNRERLIDQIKPISYTYDQSLVLFVYSSSLLVPKKHLIYVDKRPGEYEFTFYHPKRSPYVVFIVMFDEIVNDWLTEDGW